MMTAFWGCAADIATVMKARIERMVNFMVFVFFVCSGVVVGMLRRKSEGGIDALYRKPGCVAAKASGETAGHGHVPYVIVP